MDAFFEGIQEAPVKLAVVGCGCSVATEPVAEISYRWNISQVITCINIPNVPSIPAGVLTLTSLSESNVFSLYDLLYWLSGSKF